MKPVVLFRSNRDTSDEMKVATKHFPVVESRACLSDRLVIARYSALPFYHELERDLKLQGSRLINSLLEHQYVANFDYYEDLKEHTAETWFELYRVPKCSGPWIVKGRTNSRKFDWHELMYADDWASLVDVYTKLSKDHLLGPQGLIIRKFLYLDLVEHGVNLQPMFNEWRFFSYKGQILSWGYYWVNGEEKGKLDEGGLAFAKMIAEKIKDKIPFVVIDIAKQIDGSWVLIELNDGQMSGLSDNDPEILYERLRNLVDATLPEADT